MRKLSPMEMTEKILRIVQDANQIQASYMRSELYQLFRKYEIRESNEGNSDYPDATFTYLRSEELKSNE